MAISRLFPILVFFFGCSVSDTTTTSPEEESVPEYDRSDWKHWSDLDGDCQDTRQEVLIRDSQEPVVFTDEKECRVATGKWVDPYSSTVITDPSLVDIDHIVALQDAHESGGWRWIPEDKEKFANDLEQLTVSSRTTNRSKGSRGPDEWLPPLETFRCEYLDIWLAIKTRYGLELSCSEEATINQMKRTCLAGQVPVLPQN